MNISSTVFRVPNLQSTAALTTKRLILEDYSVIEQYTDTIDASGTLYLEENVLFMMLEGNLQLKFGTQKFVLNRNEMILLRKGSVVAFEKRGNPENGNQSDFISLSISEQLLKSFLSNSDLKIPKIREKIQTEVFPISICMDSYAVSMKQYLAQPEMIHNRQIRIKLMEMLYSLAIGSKPIFLQLLEFQQPLQIDIRDFMEQHYTSNASLEELAKLSGRSLSSFKRDFTKAFNHTPYEWIKQHGLLKAKELLETTHLPISEICFMLGFTNLSHFSRAFKNYYGNTPSNVRKQ